MPGSEQDDFLSKRTNLLLRNNCPALQMALYFRIVNDPSAIKTGQRDAPIYRPKVPHGIHYLHGIRLSGRDFAGRKVDSWQS
jgi:hypothetical protein